MKQIDVEELKALVESDRHYALLDIREHGEYALGHIPGASPVPRGDLEFCIPRTISSQDVTIVLYCDNGQRSQRAADTLTAMGYCNVHILGGGLGAWKAKSLPLDKGIKSRGKETAERLAVETGVPELSVGELLERKRQGELMYIIDTRTSEEFQRGHIPGAFNVPGGQLLLDAEFVAVIKNATIVTCCAGRTRGVMGAYILREMGFPHVYSLINGVLAWAAEGLPLEQGPEPIVVPQPRQYVPKIITAPELNDALKGTCAPTVVDLRPKGVFASGHISGAYWLPRGLLELRLRNMLADEHNPVVFCCEVGDRSALAAETTHRMGLVHVQVLSGGMAAWSEAGLPLEVGFQRVNEVTPADINDMIRASGAAAATKEALQAAMKEKMDILDRVKEKVILEDR